ncbi:hypothetical protein B5S28_g3318 [[Candida] boidinii]|uniref:Unnamed protein product n=1 Tax=Candida boidinii TaxID=5477 RepID=A0ACB5THV2_CANBO|nr:hypothetical protein B5S28_g3318 [[Candida] boidinii]OWB62752.1 hypothetical protein B5S29_g3697 [[Candida] boidinii]OWB74483.1 hypothetical protein B5S31_g4279 [[Candida] boidinii]GME88898.1 unnamed protein product [[Candida] boidinii]GME95644.1 unnamed protein product [[Candida] boidinii]
MRILGDVTVKNYLKNLSFQDLKLYQNKLSQALIAYHYDHSLIPQRIVTTTKYATHLFMPSVGETVGFKALTGSKEGFKGITVILNKENGVPIGLVNASTLTAFRTALTSTLGLSKTFDDSIKIETPLNENLICFGVGQQGEWHIRLSLILYPKKFKKILIVNRSYENALKLINLLKDEFKDYEFEFIKSDDKSLIKSSFENASVIYSCIPSTEPTIYKEYIDNCKLSKIFIGTIGSYKPHMIEVEGKLMKELILNKGGKVIVDSVEHCLEEAGEFIQNDIGEESLIEVSELYMDESEQTAQAKSELEWIKSNDCKVVYSKAVGLAIMDMSIGEYLLTHAENDNVGFVFDGF